MDLAEIEFIKENKMKHCKDGVSKTKSKNDAKKT